MKNILLVFLLVLNVKATGQVSIINESATNENVIFSGGTANVISINNKGSADTFELRTNNKKDKIYRIAPDRFVVIIFDSSTIHLEVYHENKKIASKKFDVVYVKTSSLFIGDYRLKDSLPKNILYQSPYLFFKTEHPLYNPICDVTKFSITIVIDSAQVPYTDVNALADSISKGLYISEGIQSTDIVDANFPTFYIAGNKIPKRLMSFIQLLKNGDRMFIEDVRVLDRYQSVIRYLTPVVIWKYSE